MRLLHMLLHLPRLIRRSSILHLHSSSSNTVRELYREGMSLLKESNISEPEESTRYLLLDVLQKGYRLSTLLANMDQPLTSSQTALFHSHLQRRLRSEPVQYILGNWDFFGLTFLCKAPVLIPRPETEELVEAILDRGTLCNAREAFVLDVGAGTGVIGIALLSRLSQAKCLAIDINPLAVDLSRENALRILGSESRRYQCQDISFNELATRKDCHHKFDIIVSNPPYIPTEEMDSLQTEVKDFEDERALCGGAEGLDVVLQIIHGARALLVPEGPREIWMEVSPRHPNMIRSLLEQSGGPKVELLEIIEDLSGKQRFVRLRCKD